MQLCINTVEALPFKEICAENMQEFEVQYVKHKPTNVGRIALERQAGEKYLTPPGFEPLTSRFITICSTDCAILP